MRPSSKLFRVRPRIQGGPIQRTVFFLALSESISIIGVVIPGTAVILALSALVPSRQRLLGRYS